MSRHVLITGGAGGIGWATAEAFLTRGDYVTILDVSEKVLAKRPDLEGIAKVACDVTNADELENVIEHVDTQNPIDVLVNNAGGGESRHILDADTSHWCTMLDLNMHGALHVAMAVAARMSERKVGVILNASSSGAIAGEPGMLAYETAKAGVLAMTRCLALELIDQNIRVCAVCPGNVATGTRGYRQVELGRLYDSKIPLGRSGRSEEVAEVYVYLASESSHVTGAVFIVDGGMLAWE